MRISLDKDEVIKACKEYVSRHYLSENKWGMKEYECNPDEIYISDVYGLIFREVKDGNDD